MSRPQLKTAARLLLAVALSPTLGAATARIPWTTSRVKGAPEPPPAFSSEPILPRLKFNQAVELVPIPGRGRYVLLERKGKVYSFPAAGDPAAPDEVMDLLPRHPALYHALGLALHPKFPAVPQAFVCFSVTRGDAEDVSIARFTFSSLDPLRLDPASEEFVIGWRAMGHRGGHVIFGPDGYLYATSGDGSVPAPPDVNDNGQDLSTLNSTILRIDVDHRDPGKNYRVPPDNPFAGGGATSPDGPGAAPVATARPEIWAFGLRNPWKICFDPANGNLWCGDVGWEIWEMVHLIKRGANYGWSATEGPHPIKPQLAHPTIPITPPVIAYPRAKGASVTGGHVYHGKKFPELAGAYIYGDWETGKIWALWYGDDHIVRHEEIADTPHKIITFTLDEENELLYVDYGLPAGIHRLVRNTATAPATPFPEKLSETGLFADVAARRPAAGVTPFSIAQPMWSDGAQATRLIGLPGNATVTTTVTVTPNPRSHVPTVAHTTRWPANAVLTRTLTLGELAPSAADRQRPVETQLLHFNGDEWRGYSYRWNAAGTDAELVPPDGAEMEITAAANPQALGPRTRKTTWRFLSRAECMRCHNTWSGVALAFNPLQLRAVAGPQNRQLVEHALINAEFLEQSQHALDTGDNPSARTVLHVNCAHCHRQNAGGAVAALFNLELLSAQMNVIGRPPTQGSFGLPNARLIEPGNPWNSVIGVRMAKAGVGHMPMIGARETSVRGLRILEDWIAGLDPTNPAPRPGAPVTWNRGEIGRALGTVAGAMRLRRAIDDGVLDAGLRAEAFEIAWASPEPAIRDIFERFKPDDRRERTLGPNIDSNEILALGGDPARGAALISMAGKLAACQGCHFFRGQGRHFGPDLSRIGDRLSPREILESIAQPAVAVAPEYRTTLVELKDGTSQMGFVAARDPKTLTLTLPTGQPVALPLTDIRSEKTLPGSLMPTGQLQGITPQEAADLVAYLAALK